MKKSEHAHQGDEVLITITEAARRLSVSAATVRRLIGRGELRSVRLGRCVRITAASIMTFEAMNRGHHG